MKKVILTAAFMILCGTMGHSAFVDIPKGIPSHLETADYGGVSYSTVAFSSANVLVANSPASFAGFIISSAPSTSNGIFVVCRDTVSLIAGATSGGTPGVAADDYTTGDEIFRVYVGTGVNAGLPNIGFTYSPPKPIRAKRGLACRVAGSNVFNLLTILYTQFGQ